MVGKVTRHILTASERHMLLCYGLASHDGDVMTVTNDTIAMTRIKGIMKPESIVAL